MYLCSDIQLFPSEISRQNIKKRLVCHCVVDVAVLLHLGGRTIRGHSDEEIRVFSREYPFSLTRIVSIHSRHRVVSPPSFRLVIQAEHTAEDDLAGASSSLATMGRIQLARLSLQTRGCFQLRPQSSYMGNLCHRSWKKDLADDERRPPCLQRKRHDIASLLVQIHRYCTTRRGSTASMV